MHMAWGQTAQKPPMWDTHCEGRQPVLGHPDQQATVHEYRYIHTRQDQLIRTRSVGYGGDHCDACTFF